MVFGEDDAIRGALNFRNARGVKFGMIDGERRLACDNDLLCRFGGVDDLGAERVGRQRYSSHESSDEPEDRDAASIFTDQSTARSAGSWPNSANDTGDESNDVTDDKGCGVADPKESVIQEFSPEPEALHLPVIQFV